MSEYPNPKDDEINSNPGQQDNTPDEAEMLEEDTLVTEQKEQGMEMGTSFKEDKEQDLDDLIHQQGKLRSDEIPSPEES
ncbi:hypothetical protein EXU57_05590 [Segetibacter sp. 3557_3]|uniref:hypothetical protein n=1 Tax=Segetibacter sp. 3557_3 TaxID=2547429 RepID=UPI001058E15A|nr:hypothetical protein [Segetibacter sp. 3557_3]TDH27938.1 hypothetical protein EXU57_05590 [Segetibacter sp. 3557_3]